MPTDKLTPAELAEGLAKLEYILSLAYRGARGYETPDGVWIDRDERNELLLDIGVGSIAEAYRELAALRAFHAAVQEAALRYDDPRNSPVTAESGLVMYHAIDAAMSTLAHPPADQLAALDQPEGA